TDNRNFEWARYFDYVLEPQETEGGVFFTKYTALERTDADQVIFIDSDCLAFKRLDPIFDLCAGSAVAVQGALLKEGVWYEKSIAQLCEEYKIESMARLNSGVVYYERGSAFGAVLAKIREFAVKYPTMGMEIFRGKVPDEPCLSLAMAIEGHGKI